MPPLPADSIHARACKLKCEKILTRPNRLHQQTVSAAKCAGIAAMAAQGRHSLVRNEVTQNSPDIQTSGLSASQSAHTPVRRV